MSGRPLARIADFLRRERGPVVQCALVLSLIIAVCLGVAIIALSIEGSKPFSTEYHGVGTSS